MKEATKQLKIDQVNDVTKQIKEAQSVVILNCVGLSVADTMSLRKELHDNGCYMKVVKNNILRRAVKECGYDELADQFVGPNAIAYAQDTNSASKIIYNFAKKNDKLEMKAGVVDGRVVQLDELKILATLPDKNGMLSMLLSVLQAPIRNMACVVKAVGEAKE